MIYYSVEEQDLIDKEESGAFCKYRCITIDIIDSI
jgi:hypothetical protein